MGKFAFIEPGAVVCRDVPDIALMAGMPARRIGWMSAFGEQLDLPEDGDAECVCPHTGDQYVLRNGEVARSGQPV